MLAKSFISRTLSFSLCNNRAWTCSEARIGNRRQSAPCAPLVSLIISASERGFHTSVDNPAARKGTRARKEKGKVKKEVKKRPYLMRRLKEEEVNYKDRRPFDKSHYSEAIDDVYFYKKFKPKEWDLREAIQNHREIHDPTVYNVPDSPLILRIDMDFRYPNRQKCQDKWRSIVEMPAPFLLPGMVTPTVLAVCPPNNSTLIDEALEAGADMAGSIEIIKAIQNGEIHALNYEYIVAHPAIMTDMSVIRGVCKRNFPAIRTRTIDTDVGAVVKRLKGGLKIMVNCTDREPDYAYIEQPIGTLNMDISGLEANFEAIFKDTLPRRVPGKSPEKFILQCLLKTPHSFEELKLNLRDYIIKCDIKRGGKGKQVEAETESTEVDDTVEDEKRAAVA